MLNLMILPILLNFSNVDSDELHYERCVESIKCPHDNESGLQDLPKEEYAKVMECRIKRHLKCINPEQSNKYESCKR